MKRYTYMDGKKWRLRIGDIEYSGKEVDRLAAYENTGLEPEEIESLCDMDRRAKMAEMLRIDEKYSEVVNRLIEIEELYIKIFKLTGFTVERLLDMFLAGYTLESPDYSEAWSEMKKISGCRRKIGRIISLFPCCRDRRM